MSNDSFFAPKNSWYTNNAIGEACHMDAPAGGGGPGKFVFAGSLGINDYLHGLEINPLAPAARFLTPQQIKQQANVARPDLVDVSKISGLMTSLGWPKSAALMNRWLKNAAHTAPEYDTPETKIVNMEWVLGFSRAKSVYDKLIKERIWQNNKARKQIKEMLAEKGLLQRKAGYTASFGDFNLAINKLDGEYINHRVSGMSNVFYDDMDGALGNFAFRVLVKGSLKCQSGSAIEVSLTAIGVYIRDSYDFNGEQPLGPWNLSDDPAGFWGSMSPTWVTNSDFRKWRDAHEKGGDFLIFSDIKEITLPVPEVFLIP